MIDRRAFIARLGAAGIALASGDALALGRIPIGGKLAFHVPFGLGSVDPHELRDPAAALFAAAIADPVFALDAGNPYPTLAAALPSREGDGTVVKLREGLKTARGAAIDGRDLVASVERARARAGGALLGDVPKPVASKTDALAAVFGAVDPGRLARVLASPLLALVPRGFSPGSPDGLGAFRADLASGKLTLTRNLNAARGPSFLDSIEITSASDLKTSLRDFEAESDDIGWLGMGLHDGRKGAVRFDLGRAAWVVLETGPDAGSFSAPGVAQRLVDAFPPERLAHLGLGSLPAANGDPSWGGAPADLLVDESSTFLVEVARAVAPILSKPGHEVTLAAVSRAELARRRAAKKATLAIDLVRSFGASPLSALIALASAEEISRGREIDRHPPKLSPSDSPRSMTGTLRVGVIGDVRVAGGAIADLVLPKSAIGESWDLGAAWRKAKR